MNHWNLLCVESDDSEEEEEYYESNNNKEYRFMNWADVDTENDELPPLPASWKIKTY